jgi:hypothetical protein
MLRSNIRRSITLLAVMAVFAVIVATASVALATGDTIGNATPLGDYLGSSLTTALAPGPGPLPGGIYWFRISLGAGQTLNADFSYDASHSVEYNFKAFVIPLKSTYDYVQSRVVSPGHAQLSFAAPVSGTYTIKVAPTASGGATFTAAPTVSGTSGAVKFTFAKITAKNSVKHGKSFSLVDTFAPKYNGPIAPSVKYVIERKVGSKYKGYATVTAKSSGSTLAYTRYVATAKITKKGTYRIRLRLIDAAHPRGVFSAYKAIKIY